MDGLQWHITGLWYPGETTVDYYGRLADPTDGQVEIPLNDSRRANVTVSLFEPLIAAIHTFTYTVALKAYYRDQLVFWGPITLLEVDYAANSARINAVDPSVRLIHHFLRRGDLAGASTAELTAANDDKGTVSVDHLGLRLLRDAGNNTAAQTSRGVPDLGITNGTNDFGTAVGIMGVTRGDQVWSTMQQLAQTAAGPDFELEPVETTVGAYAQLNTYASQGTDISADVAFHYGTGKQNLDGLAFTEGSKFITHAHVLSRDGKYRFTEADTDSSGVAGVYVEWDATDFDAAQLTAAQAETVLRAYGQEIIKAYGRPLLTVTLTPPLDTDASYHYLTDYQVGDIIGVAGRIGFLELTQSEHRIVAVRLQQAGVANEVKPEIEVIPSIVDARGDSLTGSED